MFLPTRWVKAGWVKDLDIEGRPISSKVHKFYQLSIFIYFLTTCAFCSAHYQQSVTAVCEKKIKKKLINKTKKTF